MRMWVINDTDNCRPWLRREGQRQRERAYHCMKNNNNNLLLGLNCWEILVKPCNGADLSVIYCGIHTYSNPTMWWEKTHTQTIVMLPSKDLAALTASAPSISESTASWPWMASLCGGSGEWTDLNTCIKDFSNWSRMLDGNIQMDKTSSLLFDPVFESLVSV